MNMTTRETAMILAALRRLQIHWQGRLPNTSEQESIRDIATNSGSFAALSSEEIDALCERLNFEGQAETPLRKACEEFLRKFDSVNGEDIDGTIWPIRKALFGAINR